MRYKISSLIRLWYGGYSSIRFEKKRLNPGISVRPHPRPPGERHAQVSGGLGYDI